MPENFLNLSDEGGSNYFAPEDLNFELKYFPTKLIPGIF